MASEAPISNSSHTGNQHTLSIFSWRTASRKDTDNPLRGFLHAVGINLNKEKISLAVQWWFGSSLRRIFAGSMQAFFTLWKPRRQPRCKTNKKKITQGIYLQFRIPLVLHRLLCSLAAVSLVIHGQINFSAIKHTGFKVYTCVVKLTDYRGFRYYHIISHHISLFKF